MPNKFNSASNDWFVIGSGDEIATLQCRDTGEIATIHVDELEKMGA